MNARETLNSLMAECLEDADKIVLDALGDRGAARHQMVATVAVALFNKRPIAEHVISRMRRPLTEWPERIVGWQFTGGPWG